MVSRCSSKIPPPTVDSRPHKAAITHTVQHLMFENQKDQKLIGPAHYWQLPLQHAYHVPLLANGTPRHEHPWGYFIVTSKQDYIMCEQTESTNWPRVTFFPPHAIGGLCHWPEKNIFHSWLWGELISGELHLLFTVNGSPNLRLRLKEQSAGFHPCSRACSLKVHM